MAKRAKPNIRAAEKRNQTLALLAADAADGKRAEDIRVLDVRTVCDYADFFVIATAASVTQLKGVAWSIEDAMAKEGVRPLSREGIRNGKWVLLDFGDVVVHLFDETTRSFYDLDNLWGDAKKVRWKPKAAARAAETDASST